MSGNLKNKYEASLRKLTYLGEFFTRYYRGAGQGLWEGSHVSLELLSVVCFWERTFFCLVVW